MKLGDPRRLIQKIPDDAQRLLLYLGIAASGFLLAYIVVAFVVFPNVGVADDVKVPAIVGLAYDEASRRLGAVGLKASLGESRVSGSAPRTTVLAQTPAAGIVSARGTRVTLDVSAGQQSTTVPTVVGLTLSDALAALRGVGLMAGQTREEPNDKARGIVLRARPDAGQVVPAGTAVDLVLSVGPPQLTMPDLTGRNLDEARATLEQLGLTMAPVYYDSLSSSPPGSVIGQSPLAGAPLSSRTTITLRVAGKP
jgi:serine/threonine-protein kinase